MDGGLDLPGALGAEVVLAAGLSFGASPISSSAVTQFAGVGAEVGALVGSTWG